MKYTETNCPFTRKKCNHVTAIPNALPPHFHQVLTPEFFKCFCEKTCIKTKRLNMCRTAIYEKIKRPLENIDIPPLLLFLQENRDITHVNIASNNISDSGFMCLIDYILRSKDICELDVQNNNITDRGTNYLLREGEDLEITRLNLKSNKLGVQGSINVAYFLLKNKHIICLNVAGVDQTASSLIYFIMVLSSDQQISNKTLKSLDISRPIPGCMYYFDSAQFAGVIGNMLKYNTSLRELYLQKYNFDCHDIEDMMSNAISNNALHLLDLGSNNIGDHGVQHLSKWLMKRPALRTLILSSNIITNHGARELSFALPYSKIRSLDISYNKITDEGIVEILNTLKKTPLLRQFRMFGNCLGHPVAKIIKRMLISQVLEQENIDVRPYKVDQEWYIARYEGTQSKEEYHDVSFTLLPQLPTVSKLKTSAARKYHKYVYLKRSELQLHYSTITVVAKRLAEDEHGKDCKCCYCFKCEDGCTCCKCKGDSSSDWTIASSIAEKVVIPKNPLKNIPFILRRLNFDNRENIRRWININHEDIVEKDLTFLADQDKIESSSSESTVQCTCSWVRLSMSSLQRYLKESSSKNILIVPKDESLLCKTVYTT